MSNKNVSPLELLIESYIRTHSRQRGLNFVRKAMALINEKLGIPCCTDPAATINLYTRFDNDLTNSIRMILTSLPKQGNVKALNRAYLKLNKYLNPPCCA